MAKIERFEDLLCWKKARMLAGEIHNLVNHHNFANDFRLRDQIQDAAGSVMHNIAEGFDSGSDAEFTRFLKIARRSASEVQSELYLALDLKYITAQELQSTYDMATEAKKLINGLIGYLRQSKTTQKRISDANMTFYKIPDSDIMDNTNLIASDYHYKDYSTNDDKTKD